jgi:hypothetical protein
MFHARVRDGVSTRVTGMGDFANAEDAAAEARHFLENGNPPAGTEGFVQDDDGQVVYVASISDKGKVTGSWSETKAKKVADELRADDENPSK